MYGPVTYWLHTVICCITGKDGVRACHHHPRSLQVRTSSITHKIITPEGQRSITSTLDWKLPSDGHKKETCERGGAGDICEPLRLTAVSSSSVSSSLYKQTAQWCHGGESPLCFTLFTHHHPHHNSIPRPEYANVRTMILFCFVPRTRLLCQLKVIPCWLTLSLAKDSHHGPRNTGWCSVPRSVVMPCGPTTPAKISREFIFPYRWNKTVNMNIISCTNVHKSRAPVASATFMGHSQIDETAPEGGSSVYMSLN